MSETMPITSDSWQETKLQNSFGQGVYDKLKQQYPGIKFDTSPHRKIEVTISYKGNDFKFGPRMGMISQEEVEKVLGKPKITSIPEYKPGFNLSRIDRKALNIFELSATLRQTTLPDEERPVIEVKFKDGYAAYVPDQNGNGVSMDSIYLRNDVIKVEGYEIGKIEKGPMLLKITWSDGDVTQIQVYHHTYGPVPFSK